MNPVIRAHPRLLLFGSVGYLVLIFAVMLWRGISIEPEWVVLSLALIAVALGRGRQFITDWAPFLVLFLGYEAMRGFAAKTGFAPHDVGWMDRALFGGTVPSLWLQQHLYNPAQVGFLDLAGMFFYFMHFPLPIAVGFIFWVGSRNHYWRFVSALLLMCFAAFVVYLFWPSSPPWIAVPGVVQVKDQTIAHFGNGYFNFVSPLYLSFNPNKYAAFPSLHAAFPALAAIYAWRSYRKLAVGLVVWAGCVWFSIMYLGEHYFVDALAGLAFAVAAMVVVEWGAGRFRPVRPATPAS